MRRRLHGDAQVAGVEHLAEQSLEVDRLGRRVRGGPRPPSDEPLHCAHEARRAAGRGEDRAEEERRRRLAVRAGHTGHLERTGRLAEEDVRCNGHRDPRVLDQQLGNVELEWALDDQRGGTRRDGAPANSCPSARDPGTQKNSVPGTTRSAS